MKYVERPTGRPSTSPYAPSPTKYPPVEACQVPPEGDGMEPLFAWCYEHGIRWNREGAAVVVAGPNDSNLNGKIAVPTEWIVLPEEGPIGVIGPRNFDTCYMPLGAG